MPPVNTRAQTQAMSQSKKDSSQARQPNFDMPLSTSAPRTTHTPTTYTFSDVHQLPATAPTYTHPVSVSHTQHTHDTTDDDFRHPITVSPAAIQSLISLPSFLGDPTSDVNDLVYQFNTLPNALQVPRGSRVAILPLLFKSDVQSWFKELPS